MKGKLFLVGLGPGTEKHMTVKAAEAIKNAELIVGYKTYLDLIKNLIKGKRVISAGMTQEIERAKIAVEKAIDGKKVALVSSGDPGIYAMGSAVFEYLKEKNLSIEIEVIPGITAASAAAALLGSPLGNDFAVISLSDLLTPWKIIQERLENAAKADFVIVLYNPKSSGREKQFEMAVRILKKYRNSSTPVGIVRNAMRKNESVTITSLAELMHQKIDMLTTLIIGSSKTFIYGGKMITPRGYETR